MYFNSYTVSTSQHQWRFNDETVHWFIRFKPLENICHSSLLFAESLWKIQILCIHIISYYAAFFCWNEAGQIILYILSTNKLMIYRHHHPGRLTFMTLSIALDSGFLHQGWINALEGFIDSLVQKSSIQCFNWVSSILSNIFII